MQIPTPNVTGPGRSMVVTGATGFIGKTLVALLLSDGHTVTTLTRDAAKSAAGIWRDGGLPRME